MSLVSHLFENSWQAGGVESEIPEYFGRRKAASSQFGRELGHSGLRVPEKNVSRLQIDSDKLTVGQSVLLDFDGGKRQELKSLFVSRQ